MQEHIHKYLVLYRKLSIPKLGSFVIKEEPAYVDAVSGQLFPPKQVLIFEEGSYAASDRFFFDFLAEEMGVDAIAAIHAFNEFSGRLTQEVSSKEEVNLSGWGRFSKTVDGNIDFTPDTTVTELLPVISLEKDIIEASAYEEKAPNDYWWFYAIVLLIFGLGALAYYYL
jgi:hypothetical protein